MAKNSKAQQDAQRRERMERLQREEQERKKKENRIFVYAMVAIFLIAVVVIAVVLGGAMKNKKPGETTTTTTGAGMQYPNAPKMTDLDFSTVEDFSRFTVSENATDYVSFNVTYKDDNGQTQTGDIVVRLYENVAPITVAHFKELVAAKTYDGMIFHRVIKDFMIQAGGYLADGSYVEPESTIKGEFSSNGYNNNLNHVRGVLSMARGDPYDSASAQFFIMHKDKPHLNGYYASFGFTVYGMDTVDAIAVQATSQSDKPLDNVVINTARFVTLNPAA